MRADVFQAVALSCHANAYLAHGGENCPEFNQHSTFASIHEIDFDRIAGGKLGSGLVADAAGPWFRRLKKEGVERVGISLQSCPFNPLLTPSDPWGILTDGDVGVEIWTPSWRKRIRGHGDTSPWRVSYTATRAGRWVTTLPHGVGDMERLLRLALQQCAPAHPLVESVMRSMDEPFPDMFPEDWPLERVQVGRIATRIAALLRSEKWCSLVPLREMNPAQHESVSQKLWKASLMALETAARREPDASEHPMNQSLPLAG
jgi:hypothetical protein